ncbi:MAG TPA: hypothetical protein VI756_20425 [Blastocatellia bacterium]
MTRKLMPGTRRAIYTTGYADAREVRYLNEAYGLNVQYVPGSLSGAERAYEACSEYNPRTSFVLVIEDTIEGKLWVSVEADKHITPEVAFSVNLLRERGVPDSLVAGLVAHIEAGTGPGRTLITPDFPALIN